ncbi:MAG: phosphate signaling complex protein PhoU [Rhodospirillales bacterium]|nr:phosphate signaling complex protein PhoU [Rhodospirillales bacterium]
MTGQGGGHIVKSFDDNLDLLRQTVVRMGGITESQLQRAVQALSRRDAGMAAEVVRDDADVDALEQEVSNQAVRLLALRQPMANDLREIVAALKIASDLERIGDYSANMAKRCIALTQLPSMRPASAIPRLARLVQEIVRQSIDAYVTRNPEGALEVWRRDEEVDEVYSGLFRELLTYMMEDPRNITPCTHLMFIAKNVERIGDHATNLAEVLYYQVTGKTIAGGRPKGDASPFEVAQPEDG